MVVGNGGSPPARRTSVTLADWDSRAAICFGCALAQELLQRPRGSLMRAGLAFLAPTLIVVSAPGLLGRPAVAAASSPAFPILVMGDSYSAGNGAGAYKGAKGCWRSPNNYAHLYATALERPPYSQPTAYETVACSGDTTGAFFSTTHNRRPQLDGVNRRYGLILLTTGGDDADFGEIVKNCLIQKLRDGAHCNSDLSTAENLVNDGTLEGRVRRVLRAIRTRANAHATIVLLGYPYLENNVAYRLPYGRNQVVPVGKRLRAIEDKGNALQQRVVDALNSHDHTRSFVFAETRQLFKGHELSATDSNPNRWFVEPLTDSTFASYETWYHPNPKGWAEEANLLLRDASIPKHNPITPATRSRTIECQTTTLYVTLATNTDCGTAERVHEAWGTFAVSNCTTSLYPCQFTYEGWVCSERPKAVEGSILTCRNSGARRLEYSGN
jgi:hypothetical protein